MTYTRAFTVLLLIFSRGGAAANLRAGSQEDRSLASYYHTLTTSELGNPNPDSAIGNPLKGLMESPLYTRPPYIANIPLAVEFYYIGLNEIMFGNPDVVGESKAFNWTVLDNYLSGSASRNSHAVLRVILHFPGKDLKVPRYLIDAGIELRNYSGGISPYYGDAQLLVALQQFISRFGLRYDGDKRLGFIQAGLLGFWGEWHTSGNGFLPEEVEEMAVGWYASSFSKTPIQIRFPKASSYAAGFGLHDDSFAYQTLDGAANGGQVKSFYFWPKVLSGGQGDFWKRGVMGGETRGEIQQEVFEPTYAARTFQKQDFMECINVTHATYMFHHNAFKNGGYSGTELDNARWAHARMGYNFHVPNISVKASSSDGQVDVDVTLTQIGVAPFYYDLSIAIQCPGMSKQIVGGVDTLIDIGAFKVFGFTGIPAMATCLGSLSLSLESSYAYAGRPIKFAQGTGTIAFSLPLPEQVGPPPPTTAPVPVPVNAPVSAPASGPVPAPMTPPIVSPVAAPTSSATTLTLIDANADVELGSLTDGMTINLLLFPSLNVRANPATSFSTGSVQFTYDGNIFTLENGAPYAFKGNSGSNYNSWTPSLGVHTIVATPYSAKDAQGIAGATAKATFTVINGDPAPVSAPVAAPVALPVAPPSGSTLGVISLVLINADTDLPIQTLLNGVTLSYTALKTKNWNIRAVTNPDPTGKVRFAYDNSANYRTDSFSPYAIGGNSKSNYSNWTPSLGNHTVTATAFDISGAQEGLAMTMNFTVVA